MDGGALVREARTRAGLTQAELADRVGTTQSAIARLERGTSLTLERAARLVRACGFDLQVRIEDGSWVGSAEELPPQLRVLRTLESAVAELRRVVGESAR
jgi:transcriptional regulator with XRE-family HTH domain